jgi:predicted nucleotidyltransferase
MEGVVALASSPEFSDEQLLRTATARIVDRFSPDRLLLFGSRARGEARRDSDYDLLLIAESDVPRWKRPVPVYIAISDLEIPAEIFWWTEEEIEEWCDVKTHYIHNAMKEGIVLHEKIPARSRENALGEGAR